MANSRSPTEMPAQGSLRVGSERCSWCSCPGRHLHRSGGAPLAGAGRTPRTQHPAGSLAISPGCSCPAQELLPCRSKAARRGATALTRFTRKPSFSTPASSSIVASREQSRAPAGNCLSPGSLSLCT